MDMAFPSYKKRIIAAILGAAPATKKLFLFGSRARRDNKNLHSDIDIGVVAENRFSFLHPAKIEDALDRLNTLYTVEVVDFTQREDAFTREALKDMVLLYEKTLRLLQDRKWLIKKISRIYVFLSSDLSWWKVFAYRLLRRFCLFPSQAQTKNSLFSAHFASLR